LRWKNQSIVDLANSLDFRKAYAFPPVSWSMQDQLIDVGLSPYGYDPPMAATLACRSSRFSNAPRPVVHDGVAYISTGS